MHRLFVFIPAFCMLFSLGAQYTQTDLKVYNFADGLSHRNVFSITQDSSGLLWFGTIAGLNRFDGYNFLDYSSDPAFTDLQLVSHLTLGSDSTLYAAGPDFLVATHLSDGSFTSHKLKKGPVVRRQSRVPTSIAAGPNGLFFVLQEEMSGRLSINYFQPGIDSLPRQLYELSGRYNQRPLIRIGDTLYCGAQQNELWLFDIHSGQRIGTQTIERNKTNAGRITALAEANGKLYLLFDDGGLYYHQPGTDQFIHFPTPPPVRYNQALQTLHVHPNGDIFVGGFGQMWLYDSWRRSWEDLDAPIRQLVKNTATYRDVLVDLSGAVWLATDFGAVRLTRSDRLFTQYLSGGSEYCSNIFCSTRGITEDAKGNIYISYYNSIHILEPNTNHIQPLFPANDYFNYPYGLIHHAGYLYTGDGVRIRLSDLEKRELFVDHGESEGAVALSPDSLIWFGYDRQLIIYNPRQDSLQLYRDRAGRSWAQISGSPISFILPLKEEVYVGTTDAGLYHLNLRNDAIRHWQADSTINSLRSNRINALHLWEGQDFKVAKKEANSQALFLATASGLHRIDTKSGEVIIYDEDDGLPNDYLNGILPEGDTALWVSTDHGLCRFSLQTEHCINFFTADGLSSNEFNRISFYRSRDGRLYFGGLNGVNAFSPEPRFLNYRRQKAEVPLLLTSFSYVDPLTDSLYRFQLADLDKIERLDLRYRDRLFNFEFSLADFRHPSQNRYSYYLEGYDQGWSAESTDRRLRFNDLPPGDYTLRVRARVAQEDWAGRQLSLPIRVRQPFYYNWWFWVALISCLTLVGFAILRYRIYLAEKQRKELERTVQRRTAELAEEKQKSEELLLNILPAQTAKELKEYGKAVAHRYDQVTVFFSDFVAFTAIANALEPEELVEELDFCFRTFDQIVSRYGLEKIKTIGDAYLFIGGLQGQPQVAAIDCVKAALDIQTFLRNHANQSKEKGRPVFRARVGLHTGPLVTGVVGTHKFAYDIWGETVNVAARMESNSIPEGIVVSDATHRLVKNHFSCRPHGTYEEHGKEMAMWLMQG